MGICTSYCCHPRDWRKIPTKKTEPPILYTVIYDSSNHFQILTQCLGSAWPEVLPFCILNAGLMYGLNWLDPKGERFALTAEGHKFVQFVVSFLIVSRVTTALGRFGKVRTSLGVMQQESRELIQNLCALTQKYTDKISREWRAEVTYRTMLLLRMSVGVLDYETTGIPNWKVPELNGAELDFVMDNLLYHPQNEKYIFERRCEHEENIRVPTLIGSLLRQSIMAHSKRLPEPLPLPLEVKLLSAVDAVISANNGIRQFKTTPVPFPLIQMSRTFLFFYLYTVPFVLLGDESSIYAHIFVVLLLTYGFMGLELVAMYLDDPFGDDPIDFKSLALTHTAFEDTYLTVYDIDGPEWADFLRYRMKDDINDRLTTEQSWLMGGKEQFADLMVGKTMFMKEQSDAEARARREEELKVLEAKRQEIEEERRNHEKSHKKSKSKKRHFFKNPLHRHSHKHS